MSQRDLVIRLSAIRKIRRRVQVKFNDFPRQSVSFGKREDFSVLGRKGPMNTPTKKIRIRDIVPRILVDYWTVHVAMLLAFGISAMYQTQGQVSSPTESVSLAFRHYYFSWFIALSPMFPAIFFLNGLYTHVRYLPEWQKFKRFTFAVLVSLTVFINANFFLLPSKNPIGRSVVLLFAPLAILGLVGTRVAKELLMGAGRAEQQAKSKSSEPRPVLVIGGTGYIGCWLVRRLLEEGHHVRVLDSGVYGLEPIQDLLAQPRLDYQNGDCRNIQDVVKAMRGVSNVVHLAAIVGDPACEVDRKTTIEINYAATRMLVEIAKGNGVERFLFASSCSVYGATDELMDENSEVAPISLYGETKQASERALLEAAGDGFHPVLMRFATVFGLTQRPRFDLVVNLLSAKASQEGLITIYNGQQWRPFVHVKDLSEAMLLLLQAPLEAVSGQVFNVGDNRLNYTLSTLAEVIRDVFPNTRVEWVENADLRNYRVDFSKIEKRVGFRSRYSLEEGVREIKVALESSQIPSYRNIRFNNLTFLRESGAPGNKNDLDREIMAAFTGEHIHGAPVREITLTHQKAKAAATS
jgi:nucleoside-diphosphate-sugar epimerase